MKAVQLHEYGDVDRLIYEDVPKPVARAGEVLVRTIATSINPVDWKLRSGAMKDRWQLDLPAILGRDLSGAVEALGEGVGAFKQGEFVFGLVNRTYAEYVSCKAEDLARVPEGLDPVDAAALPLVLLTGDQVIELAVRPKAGEVVLVTGAAGSVGRTAVFVARRLGARVIAGVRQSQKEQAKTLGADRVVALDQPEDLASLPPLDAVADLVGHETIDQVIPHIRGGGVLASVLGVPASASGRDLRVAPIMAKADPRRLEELAGQVARGALSIPIGKKMNMAEIREAQRLAEAGGGIGKVVLTP